MISTKWWKFAALLCAVAFSLAGCSSSPPDPRTLPARLERVDAYNRPFRPVDLDGDGIDEQLYRMKWVPQGGRGSVLLRSARGVAIGQVNLPGKVYSPNVVDLEGDGLKELFFPYRRGDSLFVCLVSARGNRLSQFFWTTVSPETASGSGSSWRPQIAGLFPQDLVGDGGSELVTVMGVHPVSRPRGVWVHSRGGEQLDRLRAGALFEDALAADFDGDSAKEVLASSQATNNGGQAGGLDDRHAYLALFDPGPPPRLLWKKEVGGLWTNAFLKSANLGAGRLGMLAYRETAEARGSERGKFWLFRLDAEAPVARSRVLDRRIQDVAVADVRGGPTDEILALGEAGTIVVLNERLKVERRHSPDQAFTGLEALPDVSGDGAEEVVARTASRSFFLAPDLEVQATSKLTGWRAFRTPEGEVPLLISSHEDRTVAFAWRANQWWWVRRYGPWAGGLLGTLLLMGTGAYAWGRLQRRERSRKVGEYLWSESDRGLLLFRPGEGILKTNEVATKRLSDGQKDKVGDREEEKNLAAALRSSLEGRDPEEGGTFEETLSLGGKVFSVRAWPVDLESPRPCWLVALEGPAYDEEQYQTWMLMARRVAHDLKNPLTSILLTLQRMQMEYREEAPEEVAEGLDEYAARIEGRVESLRKKTKNFMKLLDLEAPSLSRVDPNDFVREVAEELRRGVPPDIELRLKLEEGLPPVDIDRGQMRSALENLAENAIDAMEEGGVLTFETAVLEDVRLRPDRPPGDYVKMEVLDTGKGIAPGEQSRLFEPGVSAGEEGSGLGLAIAKKVAEDHSGHIEVDSEPGVGTGVAICLPAGTEDQPGEAGPRS